MFSKFSRYRKLPDDVIADARGRSWPSKALRLLPQVSGDFMHTVEEIDRLDHLAFKYYQQPTKWWHICDANPDFMSPLALLGTEPLVTTRFTLAFQELDPPWAVLFRELAEKRGVVQLRIDDEQPRPTFSVSIASHRGYIDPGFYSELEQGIFSEELRAEFEACGTVSLAEPVTILRAENKWLVVGGKPSQDEPEVYAIVPEYEQASEECWLGIYNCTIQHTWAVIVTYNRMNVSTKELSDLIAGVGFDVGYPEHIGRIGKRIVIPPNVVT
jgi:hypothetical protein